MRTFYVIASFMFAALCLSADHENKHTNNFFPTGRVILNPEFCDGNIAFGLLGEGGNKNARVNGTAGFELQPNQFFKFGGEYLAQKLKYHFYDKCEKRWTQQWAVGGKYLAFFDGCFINGVTFDFYYSRAESHKLKNVALSSSTDLKKRIAGSHAAGFEAGFLFQPWKGALLKLLADYDNVKFQRNYELNNDLNGFGFSMNFNQKFFDCFDLNLDAEWRKPFNNFQGKLIYNGSMAGNHYSIGIFGGYTQGKSNIANAANGGVELSIGFGRGGGRNSSACGCEPVCCNKTFVARWVLEPAVYMPVVLALRDQKLVTNCTQPSALYVLDDYVAIFINQGFVIDAAPFFTGEDLTWSVVSLDPSQGTATVTQSGVITVQSVGVITGFDLQVTVTNSCGSATGKIFFYENTG